MQRISPLIKRITPLEAFAAFLLLVAVIAGAAYFINERHSMRQHAATDAEWALVAPSITPDDHTIGDPSAPIQVIVYSSIACKHCRTLFEEGIPKLQTAFGDQIVIAYRHNPVPILPNAQIQEAASECVYQLGGNEAFWRFVRLLFPQAAESYATDTGFLGGVAARAGVSARDFAACMEAGRGEARVRRDKQDAAIGSLNVDPSILLKSTHRSLIIKGYYYSQIYTGIRYLLDAESRMNQQP